MYTITMSTLRTTLTSNSYYSKYVWFISHCCSCNEYAYNVDVKPIPIKICYSYSVTFIILEKKTYKRVWVIISISCCCTYDKRKKTEAASKANIQSFSEYFNVRMRIILILCDSCICWVMEESKSIISISNFEYE